MSCPTRCAWEAQVRAKYMPAMLDACHKTDRAFRAGAYAVGGEVEIHNLPGYLPILEEPVSARL